MDGINGSGQWSNKSQFGESLGGGQGSEVQGSLEAEYSIWGGVWSGVWRVEACEIWKLTVEFGIPPGATPKLKKVQNGQINISGYTSTET